MWKRKQQSNSSTRTWLFKVFLSVWFFGFAAAPAKAELTQAQVQAAVEAAFSSVLWNSPNAIFTYPRDANGLNLARYLGRYQGTYLNGSVAWELDRILALLPSLSSSNQLDGITALLHGLSGLGAITNGWGYATADTLHSQMDQIEYYLQGIWGSAALQVEFRHDNHGNELLVAAPDIEDLLVTIEQNQRDIASLLFDLSSGDRSNFSSNFYEMGDYIGGSISNQTAAIVDYFDQDVSTDYDSGQEEGSEDSDYDDYDDIPLPTSQEDYTTRADNTQGPMTDDILENVSSSGVSHSPILQLVAAPSRLNPTAPIPEIEVDFGRDAPFDSFCLALNDLTDWLYPILGMLLFSLKGVNMWRLVRQASIAASASGDVPVIHLAYDPF